VALAGAAEAPFHDQKLVDWAKAGAAATVANAAATMSVFMVRLLPNGFNNERDCPFAVEFETERENVTLD